MNTTHVFITRQRYFGPNLIWSNLIILLCATTCTLVAQEPAKPDANPAPASPATANPTPTVDYGKQIAPLFSKNCVACHNAKKAEGGLNLQSYEALMKGGDSGASVVVSDAAASSLLKRIIDNDDPMPPAGNSVGAKRLDETEVALVRSWIAAGAAAPTSSAANKLLWQPLPSSVHPINALAASSDGNYLAMGRGNQAFIVRNPATSSLDQSYALVDPAVGQLLRASTENLDPATLNAAHLDIVQSVAFSPDSSRVAVGGYRSVKIWRRNLNAIEALPTGITFGANSLVALSPDGNRLAVSSDGKPAEIVNLQTSQSLRFLNSHAQPVTTIAWLDANSLASCDSSGAWKLTRVDSNSVQAIGGTGLPVGKNALVLAADKILVVSNEGKVVLLTINAADLICQPRVIEGIDQALTLSSGATGPIAVGLASGVCRLIARDTFATVRDIATAGPVHNLAVSPNGTLVATSTGTATAQLWKIDDGAAVATLDRDYKFTQLIALAQRSVSRQQGLIDRLNAQHGELKKAAEAETAALAKVQESRDKAAAEVTAKDTELTKANEAMAEGQKLVAEAEAAVAAAMKMVETRKTELEAKQKVVADATAKKEAAAGELAKRDQALATSKDANDRAVARVPEMENAINSEKQRLEKVKKEAEDLVNNPAAKHQAKQLTFAADSSRVAVADESGRIHLFATTGGSPEANFEVQGATTAVMTSPNGRLLSLTQSGLLQQWDMSLTWQLERIVGDHENSPFSDRVTAMDFSPDGKMLCVGSGPPSRFGDIKLVDLESGVIAKDFGEIHSDSVLAIRYSPDGRKIASAGADKLCRILDAETGKQIVSLEGHTHHVLSVAWKDDGVTLVTGSGDQSIKVWNVETATQTRTIGGAKKEVTALSFVGQSNQFIAVDAGGIVRLIDAGNGNQVRAYGGADSAVLTVSVSPDGKFVYAGGQSGSNWVWQADDAKKLK